MAQQYDLQEYWQQFDENSRWVGFVGNEEKIKEQENTPDETITMLDYVLARTAQYSDYDVSDQDENNEEIPIKHIHLNDRYYPSMNTRAEEKKEEVNVDSKTKVIERLNETFYKMKETVK